MYIDYEEGSEELYNLICDEFEFPRVGDLDSLTDHWTYIKKCCDEDDYSGFRLSERIIDETKNVLNSFGRFDLFHRCLVKISGSDIFVCWIIHQFNDNRTIIMSHQNSDLNILKAVKFTSLQEEGYMEIGFHMLNNVDSYTKINPSVARLLGINDFKGA